MNLFYTQSITLASGGGETIVRFRLPRKSFSTVRLAFEADEIPGANTTISLGFMDIDNTLNQGILNTASIRGISAEKTLFGETFFDFRMTPHATNNTTFTLIISFRE